MLIFYNLELKNYWHHWVLDPQPFLLVISQVPLTTEKWKPFVLAQTSLTSHIHQFISFVFSSHCQLYSSGVCSDRRFVVHSLKAYAGFPVHSLGVYYWSCYSQLGTQCWSSTAHSTAHKSKCFLQYDEHFLI